MVPALVPPEATHSLKACAAPKGQSLDLHLLKWNNTNQLNEPCRELLASCCATEQVAKPTKVARFFAGTVAFKATRPARLEDPKPKPQSVGMCQPRVFSTPQGVAVIPSVTITSWWFKKSFGIFFPKRGWEKVNENTTHNISHDHFSLSVGQPARITAG